MTCPEPDADAYAAVLADSLRDVTAELRTIDPVDLVSFIRVGAHAAIDDLIQSSAELFFDHGALTSAWSAGVDMAWDSLPLVTLGLEFRHPDVSVFFDLSLGARDGDVAVRAVVFEDPATDPASGPMLLARAIAEVRLPRRGMGRGAWQPSSAPRLLRR